MANYQFQLKFRPFAAIPSISALLSSPAMKNLFLFFVHILATIAKLLRPHSGQRTVRFAITAATKDRRMDAEFDFMDAYVPTPVYMDLFRTHQGKLNFFGPNELTIKR